MTDKTAIKGGEFLIRDTDPADVFIPEEFDEEQIMIAQTCKDFLAVEVYPNLDRIDDMEKGLMPSLITKSGDLGLLGISIPEEYGGFEKDFVTSMLVAEATGAGHSYSVAVSAHTGIGTLPILYYGNAEQKKQYIPKLTTGEWKAAYCLTEPGAGSDANSGKTKAVLTDDGKHYLINGQKMWITNAGFADIFIVFAKIDDDKRLSAFIIEREFGGMTFNPEEKKMGIKGSSTRQIFFNDCKVPVENLLSERENGFKIALNILNIGRAKLAAATIGGAKEIISNTVNYANERVQFKLQISKFGAIRYKLAEQAIRVYASESAAYRMSQNITDAINTLHSGGMSKEKATLKGIEQFAAECAILKVAGSEMVDYVVDEGVQIYGGMGYSAESPVERSYRDARINRIFEGTNEINRLLSVDFILKRALKGELDLMGPAQEVANELMSIPEFPEPDDSVLGNEKKAVKNFKKAVLMVSGAAVQKLMQTLAKEEEILMNIADMLIDTYLSESMLLRVEKLIGINGEEKMETEIAMVKTYIYDSADRINKAGKDALSSFADGDELKMMFMGMKRFTKVDPLNVKEMRQKVARRLIERNAYDF
jgi:alkylation response protein AidB-like acyl-CoA dehydrogenase